MTDYPLQYRTSTAEIREAELTWGRIEVEGQPCLLSFMRDITERIRSRTGCGNTKEWSKACSTWSS